MANFGKNPDSRDRKQQTFTPTQQVYNDYHQNGSATVYECTINKKIKTDRKYPGDYQYFSDYFTHMKNAIIEEIDSTGACWLLDQVLAYLQRGLPVHQVDCLALLSVAGKDFPSALIEDKQLREIDNDYYQILNYFRTQYRRRPAQQNYGNSGNYGSNTNRHPIQIDGPDTSRPSPQQNTAGYREPARNVNSASSQVLADARRQAEEIRNEAERYANNIRKEADSSAAAERQRAKADAEATRNRAYDDAEATRNKAYADAAAIRQNAEREARLIRQRAESDAEHQRALIRDNEIAKGFDLEASDEYGRIRRDVAGQILSLNTTTRSTVENVVPELQKTLQDSFKELMNNLNSFKMDVTTLGQKCRSDLFSADYRTLASFYVQFYRYVNVDMEAEIKAMDGADPANEPLIRQLEKQQAKLTRVLESLERAMSRLGLKFIRPNAGDLCDDVYHVEDGETIPGSRILFCKVPGVFIAGENPNVLIQADVVTEHEPEEDSDTDEHAETETDDETETDTRLQADAASDSQGNPSHWESYYGRNDQ